jgi:hypothetical protein
MVLEVVHGEGPTADRLGVAIAHIEIAVAHINNAAQSTIVATGAASDHQRLEELKLIVTALADIRESLRRLQPAP